MNNFNRKTELVEQYDYAIIGGGLSALLLVLEILKNPETANKKIILFESSFNNYAPRTWCFWEKNRITWDFLARHKWQQASIHYQQSEVDASLYPYSYKMIEADEFRKYAFSVIKDSTNIELKEATVLKVDGDAILNIHTKEKIFTAKYVFDSRFNLQLLNNYKGNILYQQFKGNFLKAEKPVFDDTSIRLMDFRMDQTNAVAFCYVLPVNRYTALIEYTLFTSAVADWKQLDQGLNQYLTDFFGNIQFETISAEHGIIPMTDYRFNSGHPGIIPIGTAGGCSKASSGYTFHFAEKHAKSIVADLLQHKTPQPYYDLISAKFHFYDRVLLNILKQYPEKGASIFYRLFERNRTEDVLDFLNNESTLRQDIKIFTTLPIPLFLRAALKEIFRF
jgi:lycopene beta-cyclase